MVSIQLDSSSSTAGAATPSAGVDVVCVEASLWQTSGKQLWKAAAVFRSARGR